MTRLARLLSVLALGAALVSCGSTTTSSAKPMDMYSVIPTQADMRKLMGDANWYAGPPSFDVPPLNSNSRPVHEKYALEVLYLHLGTAEELAARYTVYDSSSSASATMSDYSTAFGLSPANPKVGDQVLYYGFGSSGAAPFLSRTFVRVGQVIVTIAWARKDSQATVDQLAKNARRFVAGLPNLGKTHPTPRPSPATPKELPPPGLDITLLGSAHLPIESFVVMTGSALPENLASLMHQGGVDTFTYGDYALNADTHMEVQTALLTFGSVIDASDWAKSFGPAPADQDGISWKYIPEAGSPASGEYHYVLSSGAYGIYMICKSSVGGEAATRECEDPAHRAALSWSLALQGIG